VVTVRDVVVVLQRGEMVYRIADEIETMIVELGVEARLLRLQLEELYADIDDEVDLVIADYLPEHRNVDDTLSEMSRLKDNDVLDGRRALSALHLGDADLDDEIAFVCSGECKSSQPKSQTRSPTSSVGWPVFSAWPSTTWSRLTGLTRRPLTSSKRRSSKSPRTASSINTTESSGGGRCRFATS
jgi:hypothetical protein